MKKNRKFVLALVGISMLSFGILAGCASNNNSKSASTSVKSDVVSYYQSKGYVKIDEGTFEKELQSKTLPAHVYATFSYSYSKKYDYGDYLFGIDASPIANYDIAVLQVSRTENYQTAIGNLNVKKGDWLITGAVPDNDESYTRVAPVSYKNISQLDHILSSIKLK